MVVATKKLHDCGFELFLSSHLFQTWSWNNRTTFLRKGNGSKQGMKSNMDQVKQPDHIPWILAWSFSASFSIACCWTRSKSGTFRWVEVGGGKYNHLRSAIGDTIFSRWHQKSSCSTIWETIRYACECYSDPLPMSRPLRHEVEISTPPPPALVAARSHTADHQMLARATPLTVERHLKPPHTTWSLRPHTSTTRERDKGARMTPHVTKTASQKR
jgi:hypothetical protein